MKNSYTAIRTAARLARIRTCTHLAAILLTCASLLDAHPIPDTFWTRVYEGGGATDMMQTLDGNYIIAGATGGFCTDGLMLEIDEMGDIVWSQSYGLPNGGGGGELGTCEVFYCVTPTANGGYIAGGYQAGFDEQLQNYLDAYIVNVNGNGDTLWTCRYGDGGDDRISDIVESDDGTLLCVGRSQSSHDLYRTSVAKFASDGTMEWWHTFGGNRNEAGDQVIPTSDGFVISVQSGFVDEDDRADIALFWISASGDSLRCVRYSSGDRFKMAGRMCALRDGGLAISGTSRAERYSLNRPYVLCVDADGRERWTRNDIAVTNGLLRGISQTTSGTIAAVGSVELDQMGSFGVYLLALSTSGDTLWSRAYGNSGDQSGVALCETSDQGFLLAGGSGIGVGPDGVLLIRTGPDITEAVEPNPVQPSRMQLTCFPNPFNSRVTIRLNVMESGHAELAIYDIQGRLQHVLFNGFAAAGNHETLWSPQGVGSGYFIVRLQAQDAATVDKILHLR